MHSKEGAEDICHRENGDRTGGLAFPLDGAALGSKGLPWAKS